MTPFVTSFLAPFVTPFVAPFLEAVTADFSDLDVIIIEIHTVKNDMTTINTNIVTLKQENLTLYNIETIKENFLTVRHRAEYESINTQRKILVLRGRIANLERNAI